MARGTGRGRSMCARVLATASFSDERQTRDRPRVHNVINTDVLPDARLDEGRTDNDLNDTVVLHDGFDRMASFRA